MRKLLGITNRTKGLLGPIVLNTKGLLGPSVIHCLFIMHDQVFTVEFNLICSFSE